MAGSPAAVADISDAIETPLPDDIVDVNVEYKGRSVKRSKSARWKSASSIIGVETAERFVYYGISVNLISYQTGPHGQSTATAEENVNAWSRTAQMLPLLGAFVADSFLSRYRTTIISPLLYILVTKKSSGCLLLDDCGDKHA